MIRTIRTICSSNSKRDYELRELHESLNKRIRVIRAIRSRSIFVVLIIKFNVQTSNFKVNSSKVTVILPYKQSRSVSSFRHQT